MDNVMLSPTLSPRLKTRELANKMRHGSPKFQEVLRERCRKRMREKRGQLFNRSRFGLEIDCKRIQDTLTEVVREEFNKLQTTDIDQSIESIFSINDGPLDPEEALELENEIIAEEEQWMLQKFEQMAQEIEQLIATDEQTEHTFCPLCQKSVLIESMDCVACKGCDLRLTTSNNVKEVGYLIRECANTHSANCRETPGFSLISENNTVSLCLICHACSTLAIVI